MEPSTQQEREIRAARNQSLFRAVNEQITALHESFEAATGTFAITCECANTVCIETLQIAPDEYGDIRANPRHFAVLPGHIYPDVEVIVRESEQYVVVEKIATAADVAELLAVREDRPSGEGHG